MFLEEGIKKSLFDLGIKGEVIFSAPPKPEMGDLAFACFGIAKELEKNPAELARELTEKLNQSKPSLISEVKAFGPYVNFFLDANKLADLILKGKNKKKKNIEEKIMVEFAHPNTHKPVHIGHLRNMIVGESLVRLLERQNNKVVRANYQGDVGMHIAKCLWGILQNPDYKQQIKKLKTVSERAKFLGSVYAVGGQAYANSELAKKEIEEVNTKIYNQDKSLRDLYQKTRKWSLEYFDHIYKRVGVKKFNRFYFESETFELGKKIVREGVESGIFKESEGAVIFEGSKYGLHDRVFVNSKGLPTYEAKDQALARLQFKEYKPDRILHVVAKEQIEYFRVIFKALEFTFPESKNREEHLVYGWVSLKEGKMSSRTGQVVLAEWLLDEAEKKVEEIMLERDIKNKKQVIRDVAVAAVKYSMLKTGISNDIIFDVHEAVSLNGNSGPYLLYIIARINSILEKTKSKNLQRAEDVFAISELEKILLFNTSKFEEVAETAAKKRDPSVVAKYLFDLAQSFNNFYQSCPILQADEETKKFRLRLIRKVKEVMEEGLDLLGINRVEEM